jgi:PPP family 3-phenylpropionic acid transporter
MSHLPVTACDRRRGVKIAFPDMNFMQSIGNRLNMAQAASGMVSGIATPFFGVWLAWRGLSAAQIALVLSAGLILRTVIGPLTGIVADARNDRREMMLYLYGAVTASYAAMTAAASTATVMVAAILAQIASGAALPLLESVSVRLAENNGLQYGRVRLWASSAFVLLNVLGGVFMWRYGTRTVAPALVFTSALSILAAWRLPAIMTPHHVGDFVSGLIETGRETRELVRSEPFLLLLAAGSLAQGSHAFYYGYGGLHWHTLGYSGLLIGIIWPLGVFAEIAILMFSRRIMTVLTPPRLLFWGGTACLVRWTILAFDPPLAVVVLAQFLHGFTFALTHLGAMFFIYRAVPARLAATAQSLYFVCYSGLVLGIATSFSGIIYAAAGGRAYLLMAAMGAAAMMFAVLLTKRWTGGRIIADGGNENIDAA